MQEPIKVIIADDHVLYRAGVKTALSSKKDIKVVAEADNGMHLLNLIKNIPVDVILLDIQMPIMDGYEFMEKINERYPHLVEKCVAISANVYEQDRNELQSRFAHYVSKPFKLSEVSAVISDMYIEK